MFQKVLTHGRYSSDEHDCARGGALSRIIGGHARQDSAQDPAHVEQDGVVGGVRRGHMYACIDKSKTG